MIARALALLILAAAIAGCAVVGPPQAAQTVGGMDPRRVGSCVIAAENMSGRVRPETEDYAKYVAAKVYYADHLALMVPGEAQRTALLTEGRGVLHQALARQDSFGGMMMVSGVLTQCEGDRQRLETYTSGLRNG